jgi:hypothetical protein
MLRGGLTRSLCSIPERDRDYPFLHSVPIGAGVNQACFPSGTVSSSVGIKAAGA